MKTLKFQPELAKLVLSGQKTTTWRIGDEKNLMVDDEVEFIDKSTLKAFGTGIIDQVIMKRLSELNEADKEGHEPYNSDQDMYETLRRYYGQEIGPQTPVKVIRFSFKAYSEPQSPALVPEGTNEQFSELKVFTDGGSRGNPGPSAGSFIILDMEDIVVKKSGLYLGITTNNQAEYQALKLGLEEAQRLGARSVHVYMDSLLVVNQMKGIFKVKNRELWPIHDAIKTFTKNFHQVTFNHVPRELNKLADTEVNEILDTAAKEQ